MAVTSAVTLTTGVGPGVSGAGGGVEPGVPATRLLTAIAYIVPSLSTRMVRISLKLESRMTNGFPAESMRNTRPGDSVPASRRPCVSKASVIACVLFVAKKTSPFPSGLIR